MGMEERTLEVTVISAKDLKKVRNFGPDMCYAVAYIRARDKKSTRVDKEGANNPTWNSKLILTCDESLLHRGTGVITLEIYSHGSFSNKLVGTSKIPLLDVGNEMHPLTPIQYEVRRPSGKVRGCLTVSVVAGEKRKLPRSSPMADTPAKLPDGVNVETASPYPRTTATNGVKTGHAGSVYPPPNPSSTSSSGSGANTANTVQVYPPLRASSSSNGASAAGAGQAYPSPRASTSSSNGGSGVNAGQAYPPPRIHGGSRGSSLKVEEPVMAYPAAGYAAMQNPPNQDGPQYAGVQQYYPPAQANVPYSYQEAYYSKPSRPSRRQGGSGAGMGLLGGVLGGLLLGDVVGDVEGY